MEAAAEFLEVEHFRYNAKLIINEMRGLSEGRHPDLVDEVLHSIFFLGWINTPPYSPEDIVDDPEVLEDLRHRYPRPFQFYTCQLPRRSPFSCLLDMVVRVTGQQNENEIINRLREFIKTLRGRQLASSTICVSQRNTAEDSHRYYGVSMATSGRNPWRIIVAASCLRNWDSYVADAVMTYYPDRERNILFDGSIRLPQQVRCQAISLKRGTPMAPCRSCANMFGLTTNVQQEWDYGNCAEAESVSNLLNEDEEVRQQVEQPCETVTDVNRHSVKASVCAEIGRCLYAVNYQWTYTPQL